MQDEENYLEQLETAGGYKTSFNKLAFAGHRDHDPFAAIENSQVYFATQLHGAGIQQLAPKIPPELQPVIAKVLQQAGLAV